MWILPRPTTAYSTLWAVVEQNEYFSLVENIGNSGKTTGKAFLGSVANLLRRVENATREGLVGAAAPEPMRYRIVLRDESHHALALADEWEEIERDWEWIRITLMPRLAELSLGRGDVLHYVLDKFTTRCREIGEEELKRQSDSRHYQRKFGLTQEELIATYFCSLWQEGFVGTHRTGMMWVSANYICFDSQLMRQKFVIAFRDVIKIAKGISHFGVLDSSITIKTKQGEEYFFSTFFNREEVLALLEYLWSTALDRLLLSSASSLTLSPLPSFTFAHCSSKPSGETSALSASLSMSDSVAESLSPSTTRPSLQMAAYSPPSSAITSFFSPPLTRRNLVSKGELTRQKAAQEFLSLFRFPISEAPIEEYACSLLWDGTYLKGVCYVSRSFLSFWSTKGSEVRLTLPWTNIDGIAKDNPYKSALSAIAHDQRWALPPFHSSGPRQYVFSFVGNQHATEAMGSILLRWKTLMNLSIASASLSSSSKSLVPNSTKIEGGGAESTNSQLHLCSLMAQNEELVLGQWEAYVELYGAGVCMMFTPELKHLIRSGIPRFMRSYLWPVCSGSAYYQLAEPQLYQRLLADNHGNQSNATEEIERDLHRSLPEHPFFRQRGGIESLRRVLTAYSWHNPHVGYCQGMNIVAALLLLHLKEEDAFYLLATITEQIVPQYYHTEMVGSLVDQQILEELTKIYMPEIVDHLERLRIPLSLISLPWLLCLFIGALPESISLRVLDVLFYEGPNVLFQISLAILKIMEEVILSTEQGDVVVPLIKGFVASPDETLLFQVAFQEFGDLPAAKISEMRNTHRYFVIMNMEQSTKKNFLRNLKTRTLFTEEELEGIYVLFQDSICTVGENGLAVDQSGFEHIFDKVFYWWKQRPDLKELCFKLLDKQGSGVLQFSTFAEGISPLCKGSLEQQFKFCFDIHDFKRKGAINVGSLYNTIDALLRIYERVGEDEVEKTGDTTLVELDKIVLLILEQIGDHERRLEQVTFERLQPVLFDSPLLRQFLSMRVGEQR